VLDQQRDRVDWKDVCRTQSVGTRHLQDDVEETVVGFHGISRRISLGKT